METLATVPDQAMKGMAKYRNLRNAFEFSADLEKLGKAMGIESARDVAVIVAFQILGGIIQKTPVDTGRARANWFMSEGAPTIATNLSATPTVPPVSSLKGKDAIFITNSLPYIIPLEYGHSKQAPFGMVRLTLAEIASGARVAI